MYKHYKMIHNSHALTRHKPLRHFRFSPSYLNYFGQYIGRAFSTKLVKLVNFQHFYLYKPKEVDIGIDLKNRSCEKEKGADVIYCGKE